MDHQPLDTIPHDPTTDQIFIDSSHVETLSDDGRPMRAVRMGQQPSTSRLMYGPVGYMDHTYSSDLIPGEQQGPTSSSAPEIGENMDQAGSSSHLPDEQRRPSIEVISPSPLRSGIGERINQSVGDFDASSVTLTGEQYQPTTEEVLDAIEDLAFINGVCHSIPELRSELIEISKLRDLLFNDLARSKPVSRNKGNASGK